MENPDRYFDITKMC